MIVFYDGECGFCKVCVAVLLAWDRSRRLYPMTIQEPEGQHLLASVPEDERLDSAHVRGAGGTIFSGAVGAPHVLRQLPGGSPLATVVTIAMPLVQAAYRLVTSARPVIGSILPAAWCNWAEGRIAERRRGTTPPTSTL